MQKKSPLVVIATPTRGGCHPDFVCSLLSTHKLLEKLGARISWMPMIGDSLVQRARNNIAACALTNPDATHILWIDDDISWDPEDARRLLAHDKDLICGLYTHRSTGDVGESWRRFIFRPLLTDDAVMCDPPPGLLEIAACGTGFMLTKRAVFERMAGAYPESKITRAPELEKICPGVTSNLYDYFPTCVHNGELLSEDYNFCRRWRAIGGQVWADPTIQLIHYGAQAFTADPMSICESAEGLAA